ncbi:uncharacterized protein isoform X1 [Takifugu rubripes]|uniref:uncharacterized protein isoform X1 n=1 Tax=Takifugu rubripes TaxID=31033 RepID=UPI001145C3FF|nr:uncharacterized protein LOC115248597 isoform X1 [Takifugu rubripes]
MIKMIFIIIKIVFITIRIIFIILILIILYQSILHSVSNKRECFPLKVPEEPSSIQEAELDEIPGADQTCADEAAPLENMPIPSVIIEPASSNEGDDDRDGDIISPTAASDNDVTTVSQTMKHMSPSGGVSGLPDDFLYKVTSAFNGLSQVTCSNLLNGSEIEPLLDWLMNPSTRRIPQNGGRNRLDTIMGLSHVSSPPGRQQQQQQQQQQI